MRLFVEKVKCAVRFFVKKTDQRVDLSPFNANRELLQFAEKSGGHNKEYQVQGTTKPNHTQ